MLLARKEIFHELYSDSFRRCREPYGIRYAKDFLGEVPVKDKGGESRGGRSNT